MIIDSHVHPGKSIFGYNLTVKKLIESMDECNIDRAVLCPVKPYKYQLKPENDFIAGEVKKNPEKFTGFCRIDPWLGEKALKEIDRCINELGLKGIFLHPWEECFPVNSTIVYPVMERARKYKIPVMVSGGHVRVSEPLQIGDIAGEFPDVNIIATSGGQINICGMALYDAENMLAEHKNVFVETSGIYRQDFIENMIKKLGSKRVIYGSNAPQMDIKYEILRATTARVSEEEKEDILGNTIAGLTGIK
ncbi:MAG: amidohydrolase family protein [Candidatus Eremiobacterota bacterium]